MNPYDGQGQYWRDIDPNSTMTKMEHTYWITKQNVLKKMGKKEDDCIVASDAELDAKLELFRSIQESCQDLNKIVDRYQDRLCCVAQEENAMGRFLKEAGAADGTPAGKTMNNVGRAVSYAGKQRLCVRPALLRLCQEVETFRQRAISDTLANVRTMERQRVEYRAALKWMKDVSQQLDPERQLDKFRKVQGQVRRCKARFDQSKLVCLQKIDLLAAARCNMFSHALVLYHKSLLEFSDKAAHAFEVVANTCKGYQHYEFSIIKELAEPSQKLAEELKRNGEEDPDKDVLLFFDSEYKDNEPTEKKTEEAKDTTDVASLVPALSSVSTSDEQLLDLAPVHKDSELDDVFASLSQQSQGRVTSDKANLDLASSMALLDGLFQESADEAWSKEWTEVFGGEASPVKTAPKPASSSAAAEGALFPSLLMDQNLLWTQPAASASNSKSEPAPAQSKSTKNKNKEDGKGNPWLNLFADLDPLADPDAVGATAVVDRNC